MGSGDYSTDRHSWLGQADVQTVADRIRRRRERRQGPSH
jgi:hypothetical protein